MDAAKQALIDEFAAAEESIGTAIIEASKKLHGKLSDAFEPDPAGKRATINYHLRRVEELNHDARRILREASAVVDAPSLEEMIQRDKEARVPVEFTAIPDGDGKFRGVKIHAKHEEADNHGSGKTSVDR